MILDRTARTVTGPSGTTALSPRLFLILCQLVDAGDRIVSDSALMHAAWASRRPTLNTLRANIRNLRIALLEIGFPRDTIEGCYGEGYRIYVHRVVSDHEIARIRGMASAGIKYSEMARRTGRPMGTIKTVTSRLRSRGLIERRYSVADWSLLDADMAP